MFREHRFERMIREDSRLSGPTEIPPYRETGIAIPLSHCVSQTIAATPRLLSVKVVYRNPKRDLARGASQKKLASEAYRAMSHEMVSPIGDRAIVGH